MENKPIKLDEHILGASQWHRFPEPKTWKLPNGRLLSDKEKEEYDENSNMSAED